MRSPAKLSLLFCALLLLQQTIQPASQENNRPTTETAVEHPERIGRARARTQTARRMLEAGAPDSAIVELQKALAQFPDDPEPHYLLGLAFKASGRNGRAIRALRAYIGLGSDPKKVQTARRIIRELGGIPPESPIRELRQQAYIGAPACGNCHREKYDSFRQTAHHLTSRPADAISIAGAFTPGQTRMETWDPGIWFEMHARDGRYYQTAYTRTPDGLQQRAEPIDIVIGSGKIGQTYLYWKKNQLFQLPISYFAQTDRWINSPGYLDGKVNFDRPIVPRCLECHATYAAAESHETNTYERENLILGISCERCHGPGAAHETHQSLNPDETGAPHITNPAELNPRQKIELCAQCHSGHGIPRRAPFSYRPGAPLDAYIELESHEEQNRVGVHSTNQLARLSESACFQNSTGMTCVNCHNPHALERGNLKLFSARCLTCHNAHDCGMEPALGDAITENCIDCHMPRRQDLGTGIETTGGMEFPLMPDHLIAIYPEATRRFMARVSQGQSP